MGHELVVKRNDEITIEQIKELQPEFLMISPGPCTPNEAGVSLEAIETFAGEIPILGVCLGHQAIAQVFGGKVIKAETLMHGKTSSVRHDGMSMFQNMQNPLDVTRYHSLIVERDTLPKCFEVSAETTDGVIMGIRHKSLAIEGVQFHPESILTLEGKQMLRQFVERYRDGATCTSV